MKHDSIALFVIRDAEKVGAGFVATSREPWLGIKGPHWRTLAGQLVTIVYRASIWDAPARPVFRFLHDKTVISEAIGTAPLAAASEWTGRVPTGTTALHVSPTNYLGRFGFRIESVRRRAWTPQLVEGWRRAPRPARSAFLTRLIGWRPEADNNLAWAIGARPFEDFASWSASRDRAIELDSIDAPRIAWDEAAPINVVISARGADIGTLGRTLGSLRTQSFPFWRALITDASDPSSTSDPRLTFGSRSGAAATVRSDGLWFAAIPAGATLPPEALAIVAERRAREPQASMVFGDEIVGGLPVLKPGWGARLGSALPYLGHAVFAEPSRFTADEIDGLLAGADWPVPSGVSPIAMRRILLARPERSRPPPSSASSAAPPRRGARAAIIVLTRDQPALLSRLVASIRARSRKGGYRLVVVDNGDAGGPAQTMLADLAAADDAIVLSRPGPFNFSALCNEAVAQVDDEVLVFLNDDMEILEDGWLDRLVTHALEPDAGAVGARLTYPDGRLQHVGVLAGMGGSAGHFGAPAPGDDIGWAGRNQVLHEVSAVTGACLAVAREKFEAVGGFDAEHLPVELSDIDLCFKLNERGWQTLIDPAVHLMHEESFSRGGATFRRLGKYGDQRAIFVERWRHVLRDDPVFHPALSLYSWRAALG